MLKSSLKSAFRNFLKYKFYSLIKVLGLAIGLACFIIIALYIKDELSYDKHHNKADRIYRLVNIYNQEGVGENSASSPFPVAFALKDEYPGLIENVVRIFNFQAPRHLIEYEDKKFNERNFFFADSTYFNIFDHEFILGDKETALDEPFNVVLTQSAAKKYFGDENPLGELIEFETQIPLKVTAVIKDVRCQSHFNFDMLASLSSVREMYRGRLPQTWVWNPCWTYILLKPNADYRKLDMEFPNFVQKFFFDAEKEYVSLYLQPLTDIHLKSALDYELEPNNDIKNIFILSFIALFLLVIASINYMNLATATSAARAKEIGVKKVIGAYRMQIIVQFLLESLLITLIALVFALFFIELIIPCFNTFTSKEISLSNILCIENLAAILILWLFTGIISGIYPAFYLSGFMPLKVLKGNLKQGAKSGWARKVLVVFQFTISIAMIIGTLIAFDQIKYLQNADLGFTKDNIVLVPVNNTHIARNFKTFKEEIKQNPDIISVTAVDDIFGVSHNTHEFRPEGLAEDKWSFIPALVVQWDFVETFDIKIIAGRDYNEKNETDPVKSILINEAMVRHLGWGSPENALGKKFKSLRGEERVIGVTNNFNVTSLHEAAGPFVINMKEEPREILFFLTYMAIKYKEGKEKNVIDYLSGKWSEFEKDKAFEYSFLSDELNKSYDDENSVANLSLVFTFIIIFIAAMGLFGLTSFMAEQKTKEIGIRKALGAGISNIITIMSKEFFLLILIANIIAWPVAYIFMASWLDNFAYRTPINWLIFVVSGILAILLAFFITTSKALQISKINPVDTLKYE